MKRLLVLFICLYACTSLVRAQFNHDYSQTWVTKMALASLDERGDCIVRLTFEQALEMIRQSDNLSLGVPKIVYLVGWQYNGHDDKYPAFFEVNEHLKREATTALYGLNT